MVCFTSNLGRGILAGPEQYEVPGTFHGLTNDRAWDFQLYRSGNVLFWGCYHFAKAKGYSGGLALVGIFGPLAQAVLIVALIVIDDRNSRNPVGNTLRREHRKPGSRMERIVIYRRNAFLGIIAGVSALLLGVLITVYHVGIFAAHENEVILGMFVCTLGYFGVLVGCWWWLKAKNWIEAVVLIGFMPIVLLDVPYVKSLVKVLMHTNPVIFLAWMGMMSIILIVVVMALPDRSAWPGRKRWSLSVKPSDRI